MDCRSRWSAQSKKPLSRSNIQQQSPLAVQLREWPFSSIAPPNNLQTPSRTRFAKCFVERSLFNSPQMTSMKSGAVQSANAYGRQRVLANSSRSYKQLRHFYRPSGSFSTSFKSLNMKKSKQWFASLGLSSLLIGFYTLYFFNKSETVISEFSTYEDAQNADAMGLSKWLPDWLPKTATKIREVHNIDTSQVWLEFRIDTASRLVAQGCEWLKNQDTRNDYQV